MYLSPSKGCAMNFLKSVIPDSAGNVALRDCLAADMMIFSMRSFLTSLRSE